MNIYETDDQLSQYLQFHYGKAEEILPYPFGPVDALDYPVRSVSECVLRDRLPSAPRALDLGCAVGRSTFELSKFCSLALGIDYSRRFIEVAERIRSGDMVDYEFRISGSIVGRAVAETPAGADPSKVKFEVGDAMALRKNLGSYDIVHMANLIDRLSDPVKCLDRLPRLVSPGGQLIITTPCTWLEEFTPPENWIGGHYVSGMEITTLDALQSKLKPDFRYQGSRNMPFLIREHARKFQWSVAQASIWIREGEDD